MEKKHELIDNAAEKYLLFFMIDLKYKKTIPVSIRLLF